MDVGNSWRTANDLQDKWEAMISTMGIVRDQPTLIHRLDCPPRTTNSPLKQVQAVGMIPIVSDFLSLLDG
jgi:hypothetical protein